MAGIKSKLSKKEQLEKVRKKIGEQSKSQRDKNEFRPPKVKPDEEVDYYFRILPELDKGEKCESGLASQDYALYFCQNGAHWIDNRKIECPRVHDDGKCDLCELGFKLLNEEDEEQARKRISRLYLPRQYWAVNIQFTNNKKNPEELRGRIMWFNAGITIYKIWDKILNSDDPGDDDDPKACGIFYDLEEGYVFNLNVQRKGDYNSYEASKFLTKPSPLIKDDDGDTDFDAIQEVLDQRHDLATKFDERDDSKIKAAVKNLRKGGDDDDSGFSEDETKPEPEPKAKPKEKAKPESEEEEDEVKPKSKTKSKAKAKKEESESEPEKEVEEDDKELDDLLAIVKDDDDE